MFSSPVLLVAARCLTLAQLATLGLLFASAGLYLQDFRGLDVHGLAAVGLHISSGALALTLALRAWGTQTGIAPAITAVLLFGLTFLQALVGSAMTLALHVSGALVLTVMATWLTAWAFFRQRCGESRRSPESRSHYPEGAHS